MQIRRIDIFPHSGSLVPPELRGQMLPGLTESQIAETIEINRDSGLELVLTKFREQQQADQLILTYDYARVLTDVNRLEESKQMPDTPYRGLQLIHFDTQLRNLLASKYIIPWQRTVIDTVKKYPRAKVIHWHTMDSFSTGSSNLHQANGHGELRPAGQILSRIDTLSSELAPYFPAQIFPQVWESEQVDTVTAKRIIEIFNQELSGFADKYQEQREFKIDEPYKLFGEQGGTRITAGVLGSLVSVAQRNQVNGQLAFEIRKDLFSHCEAVAQAAIKAVGMIVEAMHKR